MTDQEQIKIRDIQHFLYCPRRWGLHCIEGLWEDNYKTIMGNQVHSLVDDPFFNESRRNTFVSRSMPVFSDELGIAGVADLVELISDVNGVIVHGHTGKFRLNVVEYKNGKPLKNEQVNYPDLMQLTAQVFCLKELFGEVVSAQMFYSATQHRTKVDITEQHIDSLKNVIKSMRAFLQGNVVPSKPLQQKCSNCSFENICLPKNLDIAKSFNQLIAISTKEIT